MDGTKLARIRLCMRCPHRRVAHASVWRWPHCVYGRRDIELSDEFMEGPEENCPGGFWKGLTPVDMEEWAAESRRKRVEGAARFLKPIITALISDLPDAAERVDRLANRYPAEVIEALKKDE